MIRPTFFNAVGLATGNFLTGQQFPLVLLPRMQQAILRSRSVAFHLFSYLLLKGQNGSSPCNCSIKIKLFTGNGWLKPDTRAQTTIPYNMYIYLHFPLKGNKTDRHRCDDFPVHCQSDLIFAFICFHVPPERSYFLPFIYSQLEGSAGRGAGRKREGEISRKPRERAVRRKLNL